MSADEELEPAILVHGVSAGFVDYSISTNDNNADEDGSYAVSTVATAAFIPSVEAFHCVADPGAASSSSSSASAVAVDSFSDGPDSSGFDDPPFAGLASPYEPRSVSRYLYDLTRQGSDWSSVVRTCRSDPRLAGYVSPAPASRTALHEACLSDAPCPVAAALLAAAPWAAGAADGAGNTALHLVFASGAGGATAGGGGGAAWNDDNDDDDASDRGIGGGRRQHVLFDVERAEVVEHLLAACPGAVSVPNARGATPLMMACDDPSVAAELLQALLLAGPADAASLADRAGRTALARYCDAGGGSLSAARLLLDAYPDATKRTDAEGCTPLHRPAFDANVDMVETLLLRDEAMAEVRDRRGRTALHRACQCINQRRESDYGADGYETAEECRLQVVRLLLEAFPEAAAVRDVPDGRLPIHYACRNKRPSAEIVRSLLEADPTCADVADPRGCTALHDACENECNNVGTDELADIVELLQQVNPELPRRSTKKFDLPLHLAAGRGDVPVRMIQALVDVYPDAVSKRNHYGFTPLHCACQTYEPDADVVRALLSSSNNDVVIGMTTHSGDTALHLAASKSHVSVEVIQALLRAHAASLLSVTSRGGDGDGMTNKIGNTPLHEACFRHSSVDVISSLASAHPEWTAAENKRGYAPLFLACKAGTATEPVVRTLLAVGGRGLAAAADGAGHTPLHSLTIRHAEGNATDAGVVLALARAHPPALTAGTAWGDTPLHLACLRRASAGALAVLARCTAAEECPERPCRLPLRRNGAGRTPLDVLMDQFREMVGGNGAFDAPRAWEDGHNDADGSPDGPHRSQEEQDLMDKMVLLIQLAYHGIYGDAGTAIGGGAIGRTRILHAALWIRQSLGAGALGDEFVIRLLAEHYVQVLEKDEGGNLPLHIEARVEMAEVNERRYSRVGFGNGDALNELLCLHPAAAQEQNGAGDFPLDLMVRAHRRWDDGMRTCVMAYPPALLWQVGDDRLVPDILARVGTDCGLTTMLKLVRSKPDLTKSCT